MDIKTYNDLVYAVALRARQLANQSMDALKLEAGYNCENPTQAREKARGQSRGQLIEEILTEEFIEDVDQDLESPTYSSVDVTTNTTP
jgi:hypothetical protein